MATQRSQLLEARENSLPVSVVFKHTLKMLVLECSFCVSF